jgi:REP element-mobilizing transposase RayT
MVFHVLNRGVTRMEIFRKDKDFDAFQRVVEETLRVAPMRICAYCWMPNHWHFVLWPERDGDLSKFMQRMPSAAYKGPRPCVNWKNNSPWTNRPIRGAENGHH